MEWNTPGFESLELSTQLLVKEALLRGYSVDVLDAESNFLRLCGKGRVEFVRQATRTSADPYINALIMENKKVTKLLLSEAGIRVPDGRDYSEIDAVFGDFSHWAGQSIVVKPNSTNFGIGVSLLPAPFDKNDYLGAAEAALREDDTVLVEEMISGKEYRILVIGDHVRAVLHRVPAHVSGDGDSTIAELIGMKNADPRRGKGYVTPLEKIRMGPEEQSFLEDQGLTFEAVPEKDVDVFLRKNSNISTGGDSIDLTDEIDPGYRELAVASTAAVGAQISGVDMMIDDISVQPNAENYGVLEMNFNPALHIHDFPYQGRNREVEKHILDLLSL